MLFSAHLVLAIYQGNYGDHPEKSHFGLCMLSNLVGPGDAAYDPKCSLLKIGVG